MKSKLYYKLFIGVYTAHSLESTSHDLHKLSLV